MKKELFSELMHSAGEALDHARGKRELRTTVLPDAPAAMRADDIRALRAKLNASQAVFAHYLNVSTQLVQAWEANRRRPEGPALRLLSIGRRDPAVVFPGLTAQRKSARLDGAQNTRAKVSRARMKTARPSRPRAKKA
jgi:putative transcriptional regulator